MRKLWGGDGCVHYVDGSDRFMSVRICQNMSDHTLEMCIVMACQLYINKAGFKKKNKLLCAFSYGSHNFQCIYILLKNEGYGTSLGG